MRRDDLDSRTDRDTFGIFAFVGTNAHNSIRNTEFQELGQNQGSLQNTVNMGREYSSEHPLANTADPDKLTI